MRRPTCLALLAAAGAMLALAACGGSSPSASTASAGAAGVSRALAGELSYLGAATPFALALQTRPGGQGADPFAALPFAVVGIDYRAQITPLLGEPIVLGLAQPKPGGPPDANVTLVWQTTSPVKLSMLIARLPGLGQHGILNGATVYSLDHVFIGVNGATLVLSNRYGTLKTALGHHDRRDGMTAADFAARSRRLPGHPRLRMLGDQGAVSAPATGAAAVMLKAVQSG